MRNPSRLVLVLAAGALLAMPSMAAGKRKKTAQSEEAGVQEAIRWQRAKDRADARQARIEAKNPGKYVYATPQKPSELATEQRKEAVERSGEASRSSEPEKPPKK
jgi:hypothetical protein